MKIGLFSPRGADLASSELAIESARVAEECGFASLWVPEHAVLFDDDAPTHAWGLLSQESGDTLAPAKHERLPRL